jgi:hypothetical protein
MNSELENYIRNNLDELDRKKPDAALLGRILDEMESKKDDKPAGIVISFRLLKWAAACLLVAACGIAWWYFNKQKPATEVTKTHKPEQQSLPQITIDSAEHPTTEVVAKQEHMPARKKLLMRKVKIKPRAFAAGIYNMESAASRISAVASASTLKSNGNEVVGVLVHILNNDPNTNVRLAALDGLIRFYEEPAVRKKIVASLKRQQDPLVQINLIDLLTRKRELSALPNLEQIANNETTNKEVKDVAWSGILRLRP